MVVLFLLLMGEVAGDNGVWYKLQHNNIVVVLFGIFGGGSRKLFLVSFQFLRQTDRLHHPLSTPTSREKSAENAKCSIIRRPPAGSDSIHTIHFFMSMTGFPFCLPVKFHHAMTQ